MALTQAQVNKLTFRPEVKGRQVVWDDALPGFGVRVYPSGSKSYIVLYRIGRGRGAKQRLLVLDSTDRLSLADAREQAREAQRTGRAGKDPYAAIRYGTDDRTGNDLYQWRREYQANQALSERTLRNLDALWTRDLLPAIGTRALKSVTRQDMLDLRRKVAKRGKVQANHVMREAHAAFEYAVKLEWIETNPAAGIESFPESGRERVLTDDELRRLSAALSQSSAVMAALVRLYLYTAARPGELPALRWAPDPAGKEPHVDLEARQIVLPAHKTRRHTGKARVIYLSRPALDVLQSITPTDGNPYVFVGRSGVGHIEWVNKSLRRASERAGIAPVCPYDLRHTALTLTYGLAGGMVAQGAAGHSNMTTTNRYTHPNEAFVRPGVEQLGEHLAGAMRA